MTETDMPEGWVRTSLRSLIGADGLFADGDWVETKDQDPQGEVRLIQLSDIGDGVWRDRSNRFLTLDRALALRCTFLEAGDLLVARMPEPLGRACVFPGSDRPCVTAVDVAILRPGALSVDPTWLMHAINSPAIRASIARLQAGTTRKRISRKNLATIPVTVPPANEQRRIVTELERRLSHVDAAARDIRSAQRKLEAARGSVLDGVASGFFLGLDAGAWREVATGDIAEVRGGIQKQPKRAPVHNAHPFLRVANVARGRLDLADVHQIEVFDGELATYELVRGDLLVVEGNGSIDQIGRAAMWDGSISKCVHQNHLIRVRPGEDVLPEFLALVWNAPSTIEQLKAVASSTSGLHTLSTGKVKRVKIKLPEVDAQAALVAEAHRRLSLISSAERAVSLALARTNRLRLSVLSAALAGRLARQDPADEPATALIDRLRESRSAPAGQPRPRATRRTNAA